MTSETGLPAMRGLDDHYIGIVVAAGVPFEMVAVHADLVAYQFVAEPEGVESIAGNGAVTQANDRAAKDILQFALQLLQRLQRIGVFHPLADIENGGREL